MHYVIGSGPAAMAGAHALLEQGCQVTMLDAGLQLGAERGRWVQSLAHQPPEQWDPDIVSRLKGHVKPTSTGLPEKQLFASDYPYRETDETLGLKREGTGLRPSFAQGGLSTVWGAAMLPSLPQDLDGWPISSGDLKPHYAAAVRLTGLSGAADGLAELFPLHAERPGDLQPSKQAATLLSRLDKHQVRLRAAGLYHGRSRMAIRAPDPDGTGGCVYCGFCMYGCPYGYIYNSASHLPRLQRQPGFHYQPDVIVTQVSEDADGVRVSGRHRLTHEPLEFAGSRVFLAAGVVSTTNILLRSLGAYDHPVPILDSQYFLLPALLRKHVGNVRAEQLHALSQVFLELLDPAISPHAVHMQIYSYNDLIGQVIRGKFGPFARPLEFLIKEMEGRLMLVQGFIHSHHSSHITATLSREASGGRETFTLKPQHNPEGARIARKVVRKIWRHSRALGLLPLSPVLHVAQPGRSFHSGGSFPMSAKPKGFQSDRLGRPAGFNRVHAVDATVFPSVPGTTITLTVMANAHRIATESAELEGALE